MPSNQNTQIRSLLVRQYASCSILLSILLSIILSIRDFFEMLKTKLSAVFCSFSTSTVCGRLGHDGYGSCLLLLACVMALLPSSATAFELKLWEHEKPEIQVVLDELIETFQSQNPGVQIKRSHYKTEDLRTQFQTAAIGGGGADVILAPNDFAGPFSIMGVISPVGKWAALERFDKKVVDAVTNAEGRSWGLPISKGNHLMLFVNGNLVKKAPKTFESLISIAEPLTKPKKNQYGFAYNLNEPFWFVTFMGAFGEQPLVGEIPNLAGPGMIGALELAKQLKFTNKIVPPDCDYSCADTLFVEGKAAMTINGDWAIQKYAKAFGEKLIIAPLPKLQKTGKYLSPFVSGKYLFFNAKLKGKKEKAARKFGEFLVSKEIQKLMAIRCRRLPALNNTVATSIVDADLILAASNTAMAHGRPMPMAVEMRVVWDAIRPQLQNVMAGRTKTKVAASLMQKDALTKIKEMKE